MRGRRSENKIRRNDEAIARKRVWQNLSSKEQIKHLKGRRGESKRQIERIQSLIKRK